MKLGVFLATIYFASAACLPVAPSNQNIILDLDVSHFNESNVRVDMGPNSTLTIRINTTGMEDAFGLSVLPCAGSTHPQTLLRSGVRNATSFGGSVYGWTDYFYWHCFVGRKNASVVTNAKLPYYCWRNKWDGQYISYTYNALDDSALGTSAMYEAVVTTLPGKAAVFNLFATLGNPATHTKWLNSGSSTCSRGGWSWADPRDESGSPTPGCTYEPWAVEYNESCPMLANPQYRCGLEYFGTKLPVAPLTVAGPVCHGGGYARDCTTAETGLSVGPYLVGMIATCPTNASESIFSCNIDVAVPTPLPTAWPTRAPTTMPSRAPTLPTAAPTTLAPTSLPTLGPTLQPTAGTLQPTLAPSEQSTLAPSEQSTLAPSEQSTLAPSTQPTTAPSGQSTLAPSGQPTAGATAVPTIAPTRTPSASLAVGAARALEPLLLTSAGSLFVQVLFWFCIRVFM